MVTNGQAFRQTGPRVDFIRGEYTFGSHRAVVRLKDCVHECKAICWRLNHKKGGKMHIGRIERTLLLATLTCFIASMMLCGPVHAKKPVPWSELQAAFNDCARALEKVQDEAENRKNYIRGRREALEKLLNGMAENELPTQANKARGKVIKEKLGELDTNIKDYQRKCKKLQNLINGRLTMD